MKYNLIEKTEDYLVVNKPAGLLVHGAPKKEGVETLAGQLVADFPEIAKVGEDPARTGIVHRLDWPVSGLMVIARTQAGFDDLKAQFSARRVNKYYLGLAYGQIKADEGLIDLLIKRSAKGNKMSARAKTFKKEAATDGRPAVTEFQTVKRYINYTLLRIRPKTGRTHQIRCHLAAYGHPLVGDDLYGTNKTKAKNKKIGLGRIFLAATELGFRDRHNAEKHYQIELPAELEEFLKTRAK